MSDMLKGAIEDNVLCTLVYSEQYAARVALEITSDLFSNRQYQRIAEVALEYYSKFGAPPKEHIKDLLEREVTRGEYAPLFNRILDDMAGLQETLQPDYVISQLDNFIGTRKLTHIVNEAADLLHEGRLEEALEAIRKTTYATKSDEGAWLADTQKWFSFLNKTPSDIISCGIPTLDERGIHLTKGEMFLFLAPTGRGKSWWLIEVGKRAIIEQRLNVCHISLENSLDVTKQRYTQALLGLTKDESRSLRVPLLKTDDFGRFSSFEFDNIMPDALKTLGHTKLAKRIKPFQAKGRLYIHWFPEGMLTLSMLDSFLDSLEKLEGFVPDVLLLDYPDKMAIDEKNLRVSTGRLYSNLRGLAGRRKLALAVPSQTNRMSSEAELVKANMAAEDWSKIGIADNAVTYSQTMQEKDVGLARIFVDKARNDADKWISLITQSYATGQFCLDSCYFDKLASSAFKQLIGEEE